MYRKDLNYSNSLRKVKIEFGTLLGLERDEEAYVTLRELDTMTILKLKDVSQTGNQNDVMEFFKEVLPKIIVTHNLYETETKIMTNQAVTDFIYEKLDLTSKIIGGYTAAMFHPKRNGADGDTQSGKDDIPESKE
jgi:hypothetical protein